MGGMAHESFCAHSHVTRGEATEGHMALPPSYAPHFTGPGLGGQAGHGAKGGEGFFLFWFEVEGKGGKEREGKELAPFV